MHRIACPLNLPVKSLCFLEFMWFQSFLTVAAHPGTKHTLSFRVLVVEALGRAGEGTVSMGSVGVVLAGLSEVSTESVGVVSAGLGGAVAVCEEAEEGTVSMGSVGMVLAGLGGAVAVCEEAEVAAGVVLAGFGGAVAGCEEVRVGIVSEGLAQAGVDE